MTKTNLAIDCQEVSVYFGDYTELKDVDLQIKTSEEIELLQPRNTTVLSFHHIGSTFKKS